MLDYINKIPLFKNIDPLVISKVATLQKYNNDYIFNYDGDIVSKISFLVVGSAYSFKYKGNNEVFLFDVTPGAFFHSGKIALNNVVFSSDSIVLHIDLDVFYINILPLCSLEFVNALQDRTRILNDFIDNNHIFSATQRVAHLLINSLEYFNTHKRNYIAARLNLSNETLSRVISKMLHSGVIYILNDIVVISDKESLIESCLV